MLETDGRINAHLRAMSYPILPETELVTLLRVLRPLADRCGQDHVLREGIASLIEGALAILNADWGRRLDMDECRGMIRKVAVQIGYNLSTERFPDSHIGRDDDFWIAR